MSSVVSMRGALALALMCSQSFSEFCCITKGMKQVYFHVCNSLGYDITLVLFV
jgi:hypothetical protein